MTLKMALLSTAASEVENKNTDLLATQHLLTEGELSHNRLRDDFDEIVQELEQREEMLKEMREKNKTLERDLRLARGDLDDKQVMLTDINILISLICLSVCCSVCL